RKQMPAPGIRCGVWLLTLCYLSFAPAEPTAGAAEPREILLADCLVLPRQGTFGRALVHLDAIENLLVTGKWKTPAAGEAIALPNGGTRTWAAAKAKAGSLEQSSLQGGYACWIVKAELPRVMLLEASGHTTAYVNGEPRAGDPYQNGIVRL